MGLFFCCSKSTPRYYIRNQISDLRSLKARAARGFWKQVLWNVNVMKTVYVLISNYCYCCCPAPGMFWNPESILSIFHKAFLCKSKEWKSQTTAIQVQFLRCERSSRGKFRSHRVSLGQRWVFASSSPWKTFLIWDTQIFRRHFFKMNS